MYEFLERFLFFFFFFTWIDTGEKFSKFETMGEKGKGRNDG